MIDAFIRLLDEACCGHQCSDDGQTNRQKSSKDIDKIRRRHSRQPNRALEVMAKLAARRDSELHKSSSPYQDTSKSDSYKTKDSIYDHRHIVEKPVVHQGPAPPMLFAGRTLYPVDHDSSSHTPRSPTNYYISTSSNNSVEHKSHFVGQGRRSSLPVASPDAASGQRRVTLPSIIHEDIRPERRNNGAGAIKSPYFGSFDNCSRMQSDWSNSALQSFLRETMVSGNGLPVTKYNRGERGRSINLRYDPETMSLFWSNRQALKKGQEKVPIRSINKVVREGCFLTLINARVQTNSESTRFETRKEQDAKILQAILGMLVTNSALVNSSPSSKYSSNLGSPVNIVDWGSPPPYSAR